MAQASRERSGQPKMGVAVVSAAHRAVHSHRIGPCLHCPFTHDKRPETEELGFTFCLIYLSGHG